METLPVTIADQVATITINRPQQRNAVTYEMWTRLAELCSRLNEDDSVRVVVLRGAGDEAFSAGGDIGEFNERRSDPWQAKIYNGKVETALKRVLRLSKPTVAVIKGYCVGGGFMLAAHCNLRLVADNAVLGVPVGMLGALVNYFEIERLVHLIGVGATEELLLTARLIDAAEAREMGFCSRTFPLATIDAEAASIVQDLRSVAPLTQRWHKQMLRTVLRKPDLLDLDTEEAALPDACFETRDYAEGVRAFLEKRKPHFQGR